MEFVVVGGGVMGLATGHALATAGREVVVLEQLTVGNTLGSSHGSSRVYRTFYDRLAYARLAQQAMPLWRELEAECGATLVEPTGSIETLEGADQDRRTLDAAGIPYEILTEAEAADRFPDVRLPGSVLYQADTSVIAADATLRALRDLLGDRVRESVRVRSLAEDTTSVVVETDDKEIRASVVVVCCGAYGAELLEGLTLIPTQEQIAYFRHSSGVLPRVPVMIKLGDPQVYGLPTPSLGYYKLAEHGTGPRIDPRDRNPSPDPEVTERLKQAARSMLPGFDPEPAGEETCVYENTPDRDFVIDRRGRIVVGTGFSGHGFKFAPIIGRILADLAQERDPAFPLQDFALDRDALTSSTGELARPR